MANFWSENLFDGTKIRSLYSRFSAPPFQPPLTAEKIRVCGLAHAAWAGRRLQLKERAVCRLGLQCAQSVTTAAKKSRGPPRACVCSWSVEKKHAVYGLVPAKWQAHTCSLINHEVFLWADGGLKKCTVCRLSPASASRLIQPGAHCHQHIEENAHCLTLKTQWHIATLSAVCKLRGQGGARTSGDAGSKYP